MKSILAIIPAMLFGPLLAAEPWQTHTNPRFGIQLQHPANLKLTTTAPNGSLNTLTDGKLILTIHGHFLNGKTIEDYWNKAIADHSDTVTYKSRKPTWFVVSGVRKDGVEYYQKFHAKGGNWAEFIATYPHSLNKTYDPVVDRMAKSFNPFLPGKFDRVP